MEKPTNAYIEIIFYTKEGNEYSRRIEFENDEYHNQWSFEKYIETTIMLNRGIFVTDQSAGISIDTIARIKYEAYDGIPF